MNSDFNKEEISHEEEDDDLLSLPEKNNINDIMQFKPNYLISEKTRSQSNKEWRNKFACSADSHNENVNEHITSQLENMLDYHENENNHFEANAYRRAIAYLKNSREKITTVDGFIVKDGSNPAGSVKTPSIKNNVINPLFGL